MEPDFKGWATRYGVKCADGKTIKKGAFAHLDKMRVPLVWHHRINEPGNVLGYGILEHQDEGVRVSAFFNDTEPAQHAKACVQHGDVEALSIFANNLTQKVRDVLHGDIKEVSLVLAGANPGAFIDYVNLQHSELEDEYEGDAVIFNESEPLEYIEHSADNNPEGDPVGNQQDTLEHAEGETLEDIFNTLSEKQKKVVYFMIGEAVDNAEATARHDGLGEDFDPEAIVEQLAGDIIKHIKEDPDMGRNVFEQGGDTLTHAAPQRPTLTHDQLQSIVVDAQRLGSFKESFLQHAEEYGIENIDFLFPDARTLSNNPEIIGRRTEWVAGVINGSKHIPFTRVKSLAVDITAEEARAKGYVKGNLKKDEIVRLLKRVTTPTTIYKKQKLDRDDIIDITDLDVVAWLKAEMRLMLDEELARAILVGDGREPDDEDKINEEHIRPIAWDHEMYAHPVTVAANVSPDGLVEAVLRSRKNYKGTGTPTFYTSDDVLTDLILITDKIGRRKYNTEAELAAALRVDRIVVVPVLEDTPNLLGIIVNISDYVLGADRGGSVSMFDDFDIDYNQYKYLIETRVSGALVKPKSAIVIKREDGTVVTPTTPAFAPDTNTLTVPTAAGVSYFDVTDPTNETELNAGNVVITRTTDVEARPDAGYSFPHNIDTDWTYAFTSGA